ncbi:MAG TPA: hypothetical protein VNH11_15825 [Pirellulales bacterium]|nr:hypothetical protein [Pirellulales bacterium]
MRTAMIAVATVLGSFFFGSAAEGQGIYSYSGGAYPAYSMSSGAQYGGYPGVVSYYGGYPVGMQYGSVPVGASYGGYWGSGYFAGYPYQSYYRTSSPQRSVYPPSYTGSSPQAMYGYPGNVQPARSRVPNPIYSNYAYYSPNRYRRFGSGRTSGSYVPRVYTIYQPRGGGLFDR